MTVTFRIHQDLVSFHGLDSGLLTIIEEEGDIFKQIYDCNKRQNGDQLFFIMYTSIMNISLINCPARER